MNPPQSPPLRVVIVDDSPVARSLLSEILNAEDDINVVGVAHDGREGVELVERLKPDVVTMDVQMPRMDGYAATREIMLTRPTPIVIVSGSMGSRDVEKSMESLRAGALTVIGKPPSPGAKDFDRSVRLLVETIRTMADVKVVGHRSAAVRERPATSTAVAREQPQIVAIGASTGGPRAILELLSLLPADFSVPILIVQHIALGFVEGLVSWLDGQVRFKVVLAESHQAIQPDTVYVAPECQHLGFGPRGRIALSDTPSIGGFRPAVTALFQSVATVYGRNTVACILTGMGRDGVDGLKAVREAGGYVLGQNAESCIVYGMPAAAAAAGLVDRLEPLDGIAAALSEIVCQQKT